MEGRAPVIRVGELKVLTYKLVYHPGYDLDLGGHIFPSHKYRLTHQRLLAEGIAGPEDFIAPEPATDEDMLLVHEPAWVRKLKCGELTRQEVSILEIQPSETTLRALWLLTGGSILAGRLALRDGLGFNIGGGFHHAFPDHGEGFCALNDVAIAIRRLQQDGVVRRVAVVDCDVHQGNGTAFLFRDSPDVITIDMYQYGIYPALKQRPKVDVGLPRKVNDEEYLACLRNECIPAALAFGPDILFYLAGADPYFKDRLGGLSLTIHGLAERDRLIIETAIANGIPVAVTLAGGYAADVDDTVSIHVNTVKTARCAMEQHLAGPLGQPAAG